MREVKKLFRQSTEDQLLRVAATDPSDWTSGTYRWVRLHDSRTGKTKPRRCLVGHLYDADCNCVVMTKSGKTVKGVHSRVWSEAEKEYMDYAGEDGEEEAAEVCIRLAREELLRRANEKLRPAVRERVEAEQEKEREPVAHPST